MTEIKVHISHVYEIEEWTGRAGLRNLSLVIAEKECNPANTGRKLNVHKTFRRRPGRLLNVLCAFNLRSVSMGKTNHIKILWHCFSNVLLVDIYIAFESITHFEILSRQRKV